MSTHPNASSNIFDNLHNEISDRDAMVTRLNTEIEAQRESLDSCSTRRRSLYQHVE